LKGLYKLQPTTAMVFELLMLEGRNFDSKSSKDKRTGARRETEAPFYEHLYNVEH
jgi:hypothetical protein